MEEKVAIRPLVVADAPAMSEVLSAPELYVHTGGQPPTADELTDRYRRQTRGRSPDGAEDWFNWVVEVGGCPVGYVQASRPVGGHRAEVAWVIGVPWQGRGYATRGVRLMLAELRILGVRLVSALIHPANGASQRVARRVGLAPTGEVVDGEVLWTGSTADGDPVERTIDVVERARARCGQVVVVGIDGPSGSGKTTLATGIAARLGWPVVHMDDLFAGWGGLAEAPALLTRQVLEPLAQGHDADFRAWDWQASRWGRRVRLPWSPGLIVEGCGSTVRPAAALVAVAVWMEAPEQVRLRRGIDRDGELFRPHWGDWAAQERALFGADGTRDRADLVISTG